MKAKSKLQINAIISFSIISLIILMVFLIHQQEGEELSKGELAGEIVKGTFELNILTNGLLIHNEERAQEQWELKYNSLNELLTETEFESRETQDALDNIQKHFEKIKFAFNKLVDIKQKRRVLSHDQIAISQELEVRLISQMSMNSQSMVTHAYQLAKASRLEAEISWRKEGLLALSFIVVIVISMGVTFFFFNKQIVKPIEKLQKGIRAVADGDLDHKVGMLSNDEIGQLSADFDLMTEKLKTITVSKEEINKLNESLEQRMAERTAELERANKELLKTQKLESIGILAGGIAHDFSNSLQGILGNITLAKVYANPKDEIYERLVEAEEIALHARNLPKQLITFSRGGAPVKKIISVPELINNSANLALSGSSTRCEAHMSKDIMPVEADRDQIIQVISNLIINANHAMPKGGTIKVSAENINIDAGNSLPLKEGEYVRISIEDEGTGISQEHLQKIFDPYFTTKEQGSGLGLATAYSIIKKHNGHISVESTIEVGTTFHIYLPASGKEAIEKPVLSKVKEKDMNKIPTIGQGKVLLMDDEDVIRDVISEHLKRLGYEAETAEDGTIAIELYKRAMESGKPFDAVIMDLTIPGTIGGEEVIRKLLKIDHKVKAIVSSGYANNPIMANFREYGFSGVLTKPYEISELNGVLQEVLNADN